MGGKRRRPFFDLLTIKGHTQSCRWQRKKSTSCRLMSKLISPLGLLDKNFRADESVTSTHPGSRELPPPAPLRNGKQRERISSFLHVVVRHSQKRKKIVRRAFVNDDAAIQLIAQNRARLEFDSTPAASTILNIEQNRLANRGQRGRFQPMNQRVF